MSTYGGDPVAGGGATSTAPLSTLRRYVRQRMGVPVSDDFFTDLVITDAINLALGIIEEEHYWPWSEVVDVATLAAGNPAIVKPDRWRATRALFFQGTELALVSVTDLLASYNATSAQPTAWADTGANITVAPVPSGPVDLTHVYYRQPLLLTVDDDQPDLPASMTDAIVCKAAELLSAREDDQTARAAHGNDYAKWVQRMLRSQRRSTGPLKVRVRPGSWI